MTVDPFGLAAEAARRLASATGAPRHDAAVVLGSGWGGAAAALGEPDAGPIPVTDLPGFPGPSVDGHAGTVSSVRAGAGRVLVLAGRAHLYEGHPAATVVHAVRAAVLAGAGVVVLTNAAGSLRSEWPAGAPVLVADHLNLTGANPLAGPAPPPGFPGPFTDLTAVYSPRLRALARVHDPSLPEGVYAALAGPTYETPAEIRMLRALGADLVGMSTALEAIAARHLGAEVLGVSLVTNPAAGMADGPVDHGDVLAATAAAVPRLGRLLAGVLGAPG